MEGTQGRNLSMKVKQKPRRNAAYWLSWRLQASAWRMVLPIVVWGLLYQLAIETVLTHRPVWSRQFLSKLTLGCVRVTVNAN